MSQDVPKLLRVFLDSQDLSSPLKPKYQPLWVWLQRRAQQSFLLIPKWFWSCSGYAQPMCSEALITFKKSRFNVFFISCTLIRATEEVKLMHRDGFLVEDKELSLELWVLSSFVATLASLIGVRISFQDIFVSGTERRVGEPANQTHWNLVGWFRNPMFFFRKAFVLNQIQTARLVSWIHGRPLWSILMRTHRSPLKLCRDSCSTQGTRFVFPVLH